MTLVVMLLALTALLVCAEYPPDCVIPWAAPGASFGHISLRDCRMNALSSVVLIDPSKSLTLTLENVTQASGNWILRSLVIGQGIANVAVRLVNCYLRFTDSGLVVGLGTTSIRNLTITIISSRIVGTSSVVAAVGPLVEVTDFHIEVFNSTVAGGETGAFDEVVSVGVLCLATSVVINGVTLTAVDADVTSRGGMHVVAVGIMVHSSRLSSHAVDRVRFTATRSRVFSLASTSDAASMGILIQEKSSTTGGVVASASNVEISVSVSSRVTAICGANQAVAGALAVTSFMNFVTLSVSDFAVSVSERSQLSANTTSGDVALAASIMTQSMIGTSVVQCAGVELHISDESIVSASSGGSYGAAASIMIVKVNSGTQTVVVNHSWIVLENSRAESMVALRGASAAGVTALKFQTLPLEVNVTNCTVTIMRSSASAKCQSLSNAVGIVAHSDSTTTLGVEHFCSHVYSFAIVSAESQLTTAITAAIYVGGSQSSLSAQYVSVSVERNSTLRAIAASNNGVCCGFLVNVENFGASRAQLGLTTVSILGGSSATATSGGSISAVCGVIVWGGAAILDASATRFAVYDSRLTATSQNYYSAALAFLTHTSHSWPSTIAVADVTITAVRSFVSSSSKSPSLAFGLLSATVATEAHTAINAASTLLVSCDSIVESEESAATVSRWHSFNGATASYSGVNVVTGGGVGYRISTTTVRTKRGTPYGDCISAAPGIDGSFILNSTLACAGSIGYQTAQVNVSMFVSAVADIRGQLLPSSAFPGSLTDPLAGPVPLGATCPAADARWKRCHHGTMIKTRSRTASRDSLTSSLVASTPSRTTSSSATSPVSRSTFATISDHQSRRTATSSHTQLSSFESITRIRTRSRTIADEASVGEQPSPPKFTITSSVVQLLMLMPESAATAVVASATTSIVASSVVNPTAASQAARVGGIVRALDCSLDQGEVPSFIEMPLQMSVGDGLVAIHTGSLILTVFVLVLAPLAAHKLASSASACRSRSVRKITLALYVVSLMYFVPTSFGAAAAVLRHGGAAQIGLGVMCTILLLGVVAEAAFRVVAFRYPAADSKHRPSSVIAPSSSSSATDSLSTTSMPGQDLQTRSLGQEDDTGSLGPLIDGAARLEQVSSRLCAIEDVVVSSSINFATGGNFGKCGLVSFIVVAVAGAHFMYLVWFRPLGSKLDSWFAVTTATLHVLLGVAVAVRTNGVDAPQLDNGIAYLLLIVFATFYVQTAATVLWQCVRGASRKIREKENTDAETQHFGDHLLSADTSNIAASDALLREVPALNPLERR